MRTRALSSWKKTTDEAINSNYPLRYGKLPYTATEASHKHSEHLLLMTAPLSTERLNQSWFIMILFGEFTCNSEIVNVLLPSSLTFASSISGTFRKFSQYANPFGCLIHNTYSVLQHRLIFSKFASKLFCACIK